MPLATLAPHFVGFRLQHIRTSAERITLVIAPRRRTASCPLCGLKSSRVHSRYQRTLADLPWSGRPVQILVHTRRFHCVNRNCRRRIFAERFPRLAAVKARRTLVQRCALEELGFALGGAAGARIGNAQGVGGSRATILRLLHATVVRAAPTPRVLGVDDWARKRGQTYGTILVDLERHQVVDLLEDRTADTFAAWLRKNPGIAIIARDRAEAYADGARRGAPDAVQVADRFHLLVNLGDALERSLARKRTILQEAACAIDARRSSQPPRTQACSVAANHSSVSSPTQGSTRKEQNRERRKACYEQVVTLFEQGFSLHAIARTVGISRQTVRRFLHAGQFPERAARQPASSILAPYTSYLRRRWAEGCHNAHMLWAEIQAQGFRGSASLVRRFVGVWRPEPGRPGRQSSASVIDSAACPPFVPTRVRSPRQARWLLMRTTEDLRPEDRDYRTALLAHCSEIQSATVLAEMFRDAISQRDHAMLDDWLKQAEASSTPELREFAIGIRRDYAIVTAALRYEWSGGQTEGQINRLKCLKRQMYGRASFALLRKRVLHVA